MRCRNCGNLLQENACVCDRCGAFCSIAADSSVLSKKGYFKSGAGSPRSKKYITIGWVLSILLVAVLVPILILSAGDAFYALKAISECDSYEELAEAFKVIPETPVSVYGEMLPAMKDDGMSVAECIEMLSTIFYTYIGTLVVMTTATLSLTFLAVYKKSSKCAVWALVLSILTVLNIISVGLNIAILIFARHWENEYRAYCINPNAHTNQNYNFS